MFPSSTKREIRHFATTVKKSTTWKHALVAVAVAVVERFGQESIYGLSLGTKKVAVVE